MRVTIESKKFKSIVLSYVTHINVLTRDNVSVNIEYPYNDNAVTEEYPDILKPFITGNIDNIDEKLRVYRMASSNNFLYPLNYELIHKIFIPEYNLSVYKGDKGIYNASGNGLTDYYDDIIIVDRDGLYERISK